jgi:membrane protein
MDEEDSIKKSLKKYFIDHNLLHYASSLSFHTILALIPVLLISLFLFTKLPIFGSYYGKLKEFIFNNLLPIYHESVSENIDKFMSNTSSLGYIGVIFVIYVSVMFFDDFEYVINKIFKKTPRSFFHSVSIFLTLTIVIPIGLFISIFLSIQANVFMDKYGFSQWVDIVSITSYLILWAIFFTVYYISPNTKVYFKSAALSGLVASAIWYGSKILFIYYVAYNKTYATIYGSFSTIMFFFIWIYLSWIIFLFGAKLCYYLNRSYKYRAENKNN